MNRLRYKLAMTLAQLVGYKPFLILTCSPVQPVWAKSLQQAAQEAATLLPGDSLSRLLPRWIKLIRGF